MHLAREMLRAKQQEVRTADSEEPLLFKVGEQVWLENEHRRKGENSKFQLKYVGPFEVIASRKIISFDRTESAEFMAKRM